MTIRIYLVIAFASFCTIVLGAHIWARMTVIGLSLEGAMSGFVDCALEMLIGLIFLFAPFVLIALICGWANRHAKTRGPLAIFAMAIVLLAIAYFDGFHSSEQAMMAHMWTASALSIGLLPFAVGVPLIIFVATLSAMFARFDRRHS